MIVDLHTHTPSHRDAVPEAEAVSNSVWRPDRPVMATTSWADYDEAAQEAGIDVSVVFGIAVADPAKSVGLPGTSGDINDETAAFVAAAPTRRVGFFSVHPDESGALDRAERCRTELGLRGIKLGPNYQGFHPLGPGARRLYAYAEQYHLPVLLHQGASPVRTAPLRLAHPLLIDEVAADFPELRIVLAHIAHPWQADALIVARKHPHVYCDVSAGFYRPWSFYSALRLAHEWGVFDKLLFGSDYPVARPAEALAGLREIVDLPARASLPPIEPEAIEALIHRDSLELLRIPRPIHPTLQEGAR